MLLLLHARLWEVVVGKLFGIREIRNTAVAVLLKLLWLSCLVNICLSNSAEAAEKRTKWSSMVSKVRVVRRRRNDRFNSIDCVCRRRSGWI